MKLAVWIAFFALSYCTMADINQINYNSPYFLLGTWYYQGSSSAPTFDGCCAPTGTIQMFSDPNNATQVLLSSTQWIGTACSQLGIDQNYLLSVPFSGSASFAEITAQTWQSNNISIGVYLDNLNDGWLWPNGTQNVNVEFAISYLQTPNVTRPSYCYLTLSKQTGNPQPKITEDTPNLLPAIWYSNGTVPEDTYNTDCCLLLGAIHIFSDMKNVSQMFLIASQWEGELCSDFFIDSNYIMSVPFVNVSSYNDLVVQSNYNPQNNLHVAFSVYGFDSSYFYANQTQEVRINLILDYSATRFFGDACIVTISRSQDEFLLDVERDIVASIPS